MAEDVQLPSDEDRRKFAKIVSKGWVDSEFAERYTQQPHAVLEEYGIDYPKNVLAPPLPAMPSGDLTIEELDAVAAGVVESTAGTAGTYGSLTGCLGTLGSYGSA